MKLKPTAVQEPFSQKQFASAAYVLITNDCCLQIADRFLSPTRFPHALIFREKCHN